jgi:hypothetical protein
MTRPVKRGTQPPATIEVSEPAVISEPGQPKNRIESNSPLRRAFRLVRRASLGASLVLAVGSTNASAAVITIPPRTLTATTVTGPTGAPTVYVWDNFDRANGAIGTAIATNVARSTSVATGNATINVPNVVNGRIDVDLTFGATAQVGVDLDDDGSNNIMVLYRKSGATSQVRLYTWIGTGALPPPVATANVTSATAAALTVVANGSTVQVLWNGTQIITYTLTAAEIAALKNAGSNQVGLWAESDPTSRFDNFRFQSP